MKKIRSEDDPRIIELCTNCERVTCNGDKCQRLIDLEREISGGSAGDPARPAKKRTTAERPAVKPPAHEPKVEQSPQPKPAPERPAPERPQPEQPAPKNPAPDRPYNRQQERPGIELNLLGDDRRYSGATGIKLYNMAIDILKDLREEVEPGKQCQIDAMIKALRLWRIEGYEDRINWYDLEGKT